MLKGQPSQNAGTGAGAHDSASVRAANNVAELVNVARSSNPGLNFGSIGPASTTHLAGEMFMRAANINLLHVPYTGSTQPITDMLAGRIDMGFWNIGAVMGFIQSGQLRPLAVTTLGRSSRLPGVPAMAETYPGFEMNSWYGIHMPAGTPAPIIEPRPRKTASARPSRRVREVGGIRVILQRSAVLRATANHGGRRTE